MTVGERIKNRRKELGLSVDQVAENLNRTRATIYRYENNEIENLSITVLEPLAEILNTSPAYLAGWKDTISEIGSLQAKVGDIPSKSSFENLRTSTQDDSNLFKIRLELKIKEEITKKGYTLKSFSQKIGIPYTTLLTMLQKDIVKSSADNVIKVAQGLNTTVEELIDEIESDKCGTKNLTLDQPYYQKGELVMVIGIKIKQYRNEANMTQKELAEKSGFSRSYLADVERGRYNPSIEALKAISEALGVNLSSIVDSKIEDNKIKSYKEYIDSISLNSVESALAIILQQPNFMSFGGYDIDTISEEEIVNLSNDMLFAMKLSLHNMNLNKK